ncbi:MAG: DUF3419 family protein [Deltaproteobacteria bacterium]|nr:DUF3419 family protein [Deltaproteobacteria bacterium]NIS77041.1 DUF3419 family protein [Deltaproteobacteria bacterium]
MGAFFETLNYSSSNEDSSSEVKSLRIDQSDTVLCITGSGSRALDLLTERPKRIVSIDFNASQNFLLELKIQAILNLEYDEFLDFLGVRPSRKRGDVYRSLRPHLSSGSAGFWDRHMNAIQSGVIYGGRWERYFARLAKLFSHVRPNLRDRLFGCASVDEQRKLWHMEWDDFIWRFFLRCISTRLTWRYGLGDPGFYRHLPDTFSIYRYLNNRFRVASENFLLRESPFATLLFYGRYNPEGFLPPYLQKQNFQVMRDNVGSIEIVTDSLLDFLEKAGISSFSKYSLSDFASYTSDEEHKKTWEEVVRTASKGARVCERQSLVKRELPGEAAPFVRREKELEAELEMTDTSMFYTFVVGEIEGYG